MHSNTRSFSVRPLLVATVATLALPLTACGTESADAPSSSPTPPTAASSAADSPTTSTSAHAAAESTSTSPSTRATAATPRTHAANSENELPAGFLGTPSAEDQPLTYSEAGELIPVSVRTGAHEGYERVVIEFSGSGKPGWYTQYTTTPTAQGSGFAIDYPGEIALVIGVEGTPWPSTPEAAGRFLDPAFFPGANADTGVVAGVEYTNTFEAQSQFIIGLNRRVPYAVTYLEEPSRLVIDFLV
ncbi:hypothetical protein G7Y31_07315 [Corynebacterium lizhenjunii]|uniref:AMIN-like domain-containing protein n=1 Tax=Corynebacterium lizhenjunii TaxID=2709394 RepID=A0A7T0KD64_9CORY|nr:hypothetical protein [Corynebacterium lizhenjunii]QPK78382.1 hypothetical protein G7Y31_07315 [Corynebacterium lizhenjunii]